jgi:BirA family biotin operon repressor/biotin-[acetyl-CoA-carboxylase] ligase
MHAMTWSPIQNYELQAGLIHVWLIKLPDEVIHATHEKNHQYKYERRLILEMILENYVPHGFQILENESGKPYLANHELYFNTSHTGPYLALAFSTTEIGIDIEKFKLRDFKVFYEKFFGQQDLDANPCYLHGLEFFKKWAKTEAWVKALGKTIFNYPPIQTQDYQFVSFTPKVGLIGSICLKGSIKDIHICELNWSDTSTYHQQITQAYENNLRKKLHTKELKLYLLDETPSTQDFLKTLPQAIFPSICHTEAQTQGKGRLGRSWQSGKSQNILCSILWKMQKPASQLEGLSLVVGLSMAKVIHQATQKDVKVKWPNDIYFENKKLAGILIELFKNHQDSSEVIIGFGLNVNEDALELLPSAHSLYAMTHHKFNRRQLLTQLIVQIYQDLKTFEQQGFRAFMQDWEHYDLLKHKTVSLIQVKQALQGIAEGVNQQGNLQLRDQEGILHEVGFGEVSIQSFSSDEKD